MPSEERTIPLSKINLNTENDRHGTLPSQVHCIQWMLNNLGDEIYRLAKDIAQHGLSPLDNILVIPSESGNFVVWEGNRRITALKLLENPDRCHSRDLTQKYARLTKDFEVPSKLRCVVASSQQEADRLIELKHQGPQGGVGTLHWSPAQKNRHQTRLGKKGRYDFSQKVIDAILPKLSEDLQFKVQDKSFALSTLDRLLQNTEVRNFLGISDEDGSPRRTLHESEVVKGLSKVISDIADKSLKVSRVYDADKQREYLKEFAENEVPDRSKKLKDSVALEDVKPGPTGPNNGKPNLGEPTDEQQEDKNDGARQKPLKKRRKNLIPRDARYSISDARLNHVYRELRQLDIYEYPNAVSVMFRVFLELATELYLDKEEIIYNSYGDKLHQKVTKALSHGKDESLIGKQEAKGIETQITNPKNILGSDSLNSYIHNRSYSPIIEDLNTMWDNVQPYFDFILADQSVSSKAT